MTSPGLAQLSAQVRAFAAQLRFRHGFLIGPGEIRDALRAVQAVDVLQVAQVQDALRAVLTTSPAEARVFDAEFGAFFRRPAELPPPPLPPAPGGQAAPGEPSPPEPTARAGKKTGPVQGHPQSSGEDPADEDAISPQAPGRALENAPDDPDTPPQVLRARLSPHAGAGGRVQTEVDDLPELLRAASALIRAVELGRARRLRPRPHGPKLDARRTLRAAARTAGDAALLKWLGRPRRAPRFLLMLDGSRSMGQSAALLLRFAFALHLRARRVEVYAFSTGLTRLTPHLRRAGPGQPLALPDLGAAWGGGTRIGDNLLRLAREERDRLNRDTVVLILSDGLDTGDPEVLIRALRDLRARAGLLVWLSPLAALPGYQPVQRAVQAALPHLDAFLPAGSLGDLHALGRRLRR
ncbi:von Willebrand factor A [Deinococcus phoenicis]|uniref:von Willebrand factor A n=1 Tax=Deinococcus phoenicis TaxID=1476583 RepID=A0A016QL28_9DEIO|nr:VWA domain-containing protein [Deinococcus phoenicis]EYB66547.1 von Willebrand factor A [Deinococcus phoenicis]